MRLSTFLFSFIALLPALKHSHFPAFTGTIAAKAGVFRSSSSPAPSTIPLPLHEPVPALIPDTGFLPESNYQFPAAGTLSTNIITTVPTFHNMSLYWKPSEGSSTREALVRYRVKGTVNWSQAQSLWFDDRTADSIGNNIERSKEYRGSIVNLHSGTIYEIELFLEGVNRVAATTAATMNENFPIAKTVMLPASSDSTLVISEGGNASGYVLYTGPAGATIDVANTRMYTVDIRASYVIVKGLNIKGAQSKGIRIAPGLSDIVIDGNDISGWGRMASDGGALHDEMGIGSDNVDFSHVKRIIIQNNKIHHPRYGSNSWKEYRTFLATYHPIGTNAIGFYADDGQLIIRNNQIYSSTGQYFMDCIGGSENFAFNSGSPGPDSDIYDNKISNCWDDAIESEGMNQNVRVFNNFIDQCFVAHGVSATSVGPLYVYRNITNRLQRSHELSLNSGYWFKSQGKIAFGGRVYVYHNTMLTIQNEGGISDVGATLSNTISRNNILRSAKNAVIDLKSDPQTSCDYDLVDGNITTINQGHEKHAIFTVPQFDMSAPVQSRGLLPHSPGQDSGAIRIPNFNDNFKGKAPDMGAVEN
ncbi:MAG: hypothetical protein ABI760_08145 [Ferruginibacter sp.]